MDRVTKFNHLPLVGEKQHNPVYFTSVLISRKVGQGAENTRGHLLQVKPVLTNRCSPDWEYAWLFCTSLRAIRENFLSQNEQRHRELCRGNPWSL